MFIIITLLLTVLVSGIFGAVPAVVSHRRVSRRDAAWAAGLWLAVWVFALCAYHRPGLTVGFHAFRLVALTAMTGWAGLVTAGLRSLGRKGYAHSDDHPDVPASRGGLGEALNVAGGSGRAAQRGLRGQRREQAALGGGGRHNGAQETKNQGSNSGHSFTSS